MTSHLADTHAVVWYLAASPRLSPTARSAMHDAIAAGAPVFVSSVSVVELTYLVEKGRLPAVIRQTLIQTLRRPDSGLRLVPFDLDMAEALERIPRHAVPDMPDRMIAATALHLGLPLVTADAQMHAAGIATVW